MTVGLLVLMLAVTALACEKRTPGQTSASSGGGSGGGTPAPTRTAVPEVTALEATMEGEGGSSVTGTAELVPGNPGTRITVTVQGLPAGNHVAYIYHQSCEGSGERHGPLTAFTAEGENSTSTTNFVSLAMGHFAGESHFIVIHSGTSDNPGEAVSCGEVQEP
jgi:Cu/Zn superoxide dismutase